MRYDLEDGKPDIFDRLYAAVAPVVWAAAIVLVVMQLFLAVAERPVGYSPAASVLAGRQMGAAAGGQP